MLRQNGARRQCFFINCPQGEMSGSFRQISGALIPVMQEILPFSVKRCPFVENKIRKKMPSFKMAPLHN